MDLGESFPTSIYLMKSASIQPRTSPSKFGGNSIQYSFASLAQMRLRIISEESSLAFVSARVDVKFSFLEYLAVTNSIN